MNEPVSTFLQRLWVVVVGLLIFANLFLVASKGIASANASTASVTASSGYASVFTGDFFAATTVLNQTGNAVGTALNDSARTVATAINQSVLWIGRGIQASALFVGRSIVGSFALMAQASGHIMGFAWDAALLNPVLRPGEKGRLP